MFESCLMFCILVPENKRHNVLATLPLLIIVPYCVVVADQ
jgi:hypothetical protein